MLLVSLSSLFPVDLLSGNSVELLTHHLPPVHYFPYFCALPLQHNSNTYQYFYLLFSCTHVASTSEEIHSNVGWLHHKFMVINCSCAPVMPFFFFLSFFFF